MKEKLVKKIIKNTLLILFLVLIIELIARINIGADIIGWASFRIFISSLIISLTLGFLISFGKSTLRNILMSIITFCLMAYTWFEVNIYHYIGFFMGIGNAEQGVKTVDYISDYLKASKPITYLMIIPFILILLYIWVFEKRLRMKYLNKTTFFKLELEHKLTKVITSTVTILIIGLLCIGYYGTLKVSYMQNELQSMKNTDLLITSDQSNLSVSQFGVLVYGGSDLIVNLFHIEAALNYINLIDNNNLKSPTDFTRKIDDSAWNYLLDTEKNSTYNNLNKYFINRDISDKNEYTGIFEGHNLIIILMESVNEIIINEKDYPTIYKMYNEGISFRNNYTPRNNCSTGNNEMTSLTSLFTINNTCTYNTYKHNVYPQAVFNLFNDIGYHTSSYHDFAEYYYNRRVAHPNMGSNNYYNANSLGIEWSSVYREWPSDIDLFTKAKKYYMDADNFMAFFASVSPHQPYTETSKLAEKNMSYFKDYDYSMTVKRYMSKLKELDFALELLLQQLAEANKLDDTVIALFADHYPYGLTEKQINSVLEYDVSVNNEIDRTPMIIYNPKIESIKVTKYTTIIDLLPTLLNMFNLDYDPRLYFGHDIFSSYSDKAIFADGSWQDAKGYYSSTSGRFKPKDETDTYSNEELIQINNYISGMQKMSALAIRNNYFNYLNKEFIEYEKNHNIVEENEIAEGESV